MVFQVMNKNIYQLFQSGFGDGIFLKHVNGKDQYSYADLDRVSGRYANFFSSLGLQQGDRVAIQVEKSAHNLFIYFACLRSGLIYLPLNTAYQADELKYFLENAQPALAICDPGSIALFSGITGELSINTQVLSLDKNNHGSVNKNLESFTADHQTAHCHQDDVAAILYTSGTTGKPKGAMITHGNLAANGLALLEAWGWQKNDVLLHALPLFHIHGLFVATHLPVLSASPIIFLHRFDVTAVIENLPYASVYMGVPTNYTRLLANKAFNHHACCSMRLFTSGSAPLLPQTFREFENRTGHTIIERYGMTETGMNTSNPLSGERKPGTVGLPLKGVSIKVIDSQGKEAGVNDTGELVVLGQNVFKGYWKLPEKTREDFTADGFFKTGDLARLDEDGYITIVGRSKDLIISGGFNVYPKEIEAIIDDMEGVVESAVIGIPHQDFGEAVTAIVVRADNSLSEESIIRDLKSKVANFKVTKRIHFVDELPRNTMGKIQKSRLRDQFSHQQ